MNPDYPRTMFHIDLQDVPLDQRGSAWGEFTKIVDSEAEEATLGAEWSRTIPPPREPAPPPPGQEAEEPEPHEHKHKPAAKKAR